jgi:hypothetical protein
MTLNPFVFERDNGLHCFDENPPCTLEQESMNVVQNNPQDKYVPWLICMDSTGDQLASCDSKVGISKPASTAPDAVLEKFVSADKSIGQTPTVHVNGENVKTSYKAIRDALCSADPSLSGCSAAIPDNSDNEIQRFCKRPSDNVVV